jgi:hypothetical protein
VSAERVAGAGSGGAGPAADDTALREAVPFRRKPTAPRIVVWESDVCAGVISGRSCDDCDDGDCEHECHHTEETPDA